MFRRLRKWAGIIRRDGLTLWYACRDPRTPFWQKGMAVALAIYACSPIDLIPDFIPVVGLLDDAIIVPAGIMLLLRLLPKEVRLASQQRTDRQYQKKKRAGLWLAVVLLAWLAVIVWLIRHYAG